MNSRNRFLFVTIVLGGLGWLIWSFRSTPAFMAGSTPGSRILETTTCPVTVAPDPAFVPPEPWPARPPEADRFWVGTPGLWTALPVDSRWEQLALGEKFWWWSADYVMAKEPVPALTVTARRLDEPGPSVRFDEATNGYHASFGQAMLIGVELPTAGCWEITGTYQNSEVTVVVAVPE